MVRSVLFLLAVCVLAFTQSTGAAILDKDAVPFGVNRIADRTMRFDEADLIRHEQHLPPHFVYFGVDGRAFIWFPGTKEMHAVRWLVHTTTVRVWTRAGGSHIQVVSTCETSGSGSAARPPECTYSENLTEPTKAFELRAYSKLCLKELPGASSPFLLCRDKENFLAVLQETAEGDLFNLSRMKVPCRMCLSDVDMATVRKATNR